ncbi:MAG TPA: BON domain-containing protein [Candidatus Limnocylindria bacterium]|nr:BON domain-containing protein [Candidatus Limnocylindria bacterium]
MKRIERLRRELENQAEQRIPQRKAGIGSRLGSMALGLGAGALGTYLLDPDRGRSRRARLADQAAALVRRGGRQLERTTRTVTSTVEGKAQALRNLGPGDAPATDAALIDRVESEVFRDRSLPKGSININAENGVIVIRGELPEVATRDRLVGAIRGVPGVSDVKDLTNLAEEVEPAATR